MLVVHHYDCDWPQTCTCVEKRGGMVRLTNENYALTPEELVEKWNRYSLEQRRTDEWAVINGQVKKIRYGSMDETLIVDVHDDVAIREVQEIARGKGLTFEEAGKKIAPYLKQRFAPMTEREIQDYTEALSNRDKIDLVREALAD